MKVIPVDASDESGFDLIQSRCNEVYSSKEWSYAYSKGLKRFAIHADNGDIIGGWVAYERKKWGLKMLITPPFASHCGLFFLSDKKNPSGIQTDIKKCMEAIASFLISSSYHYFKIEFPPEFQDFQSFIWKGVSVDTRYTYLLSLNSSIDVIETAFDPKLRNKITKGKNAGLVVSFEKNIQIAHRLFTDNLKKKSITWNDEILKSLMGLSEMQGVIVYENEKPTAVAMFCGQNEKCYYLFGSTDKGNSNSSAGPMALYHAIIKAKEKGFSIFDFEGSMLPEVEQFFRQFGGKLTPLYSIKGGRGLWPRLIRLYLK
ncbi:MAG: GNAT family N-acetyltransferase [Flavobacteriales bacterium]|jgi:hypothetical protein